MTQFPFFQLTKANLVTCQLEQNGQLGNCYRPLYNLIPNEGGLTNFTTELLDFDLEHPVDILAQNAYDGAVNLILNDGKNIPRLINTRFSVQDNNRYRITEHAGFRDTNIYEEKTFDVDTSIKSIPILIPSITFNGLIDNGGQLPCGNYTFYFKLADADGNETEIVAESGLVCVHVGKTNDPFSIRMGMKDENTDKAVNFTITNISSGFDFVHVYYARSSSSSDQVTATTYHKIAFDYTVNTNGECNITITGAEAILGIAQNELQTDYADIEYAKTQAISKNVLLFGNTKKQQRDWDKLKKITWNIKASCQANKGIVGYIDTNYKTKDTSDSRSCYYNTKNIYYRVGYWPGELYRLGIVYIFNDNSLSPVLNLRGCDFNKIAETDFNKDHLNFDFEPDDCYFDKSTGENSRGVFRISKQLAAYTMSSSMLNPTPISFTFEFEETDLNTLKGSHGVKGYFLVRQKRIPLTLGQGIAIKLSKKDYGCLPFLADAYQRVYYQSFLQPGGGLLPQGAYKISDSNDHFENKALLVPDAEMQPATYNQLFVSNEFCLQQQFSTRVTFPNEKVQHITNADSLSNSPILTSKLTIVPDNTQLITDGENYFSTLAGSAEEAYKTADVEHIWDKTKPQLLTGSDSLIRGQWGTYVGVSQPTGYTSNPIVYGSIYNIYPANYTNEDITIDLLFSQYMNNNELYHAISPRQSLASTVKCFGGDCFVNLFTHRMFRNFIDADTPTNHKIVDPATWAKNYGVRCTAVINNEATWNFDQTTSKGSWYIDNDQETYANEIVPAFEVVITDTDPKTSVSDLIRDDTNNTIKKVDPKEQENGSKGFSLKAIFKSNNGEIRGTASLNRSDVNAVGLGQWITFPICSNWNFAFRDVDFDNATEEATFNQKRSFFPLREMDIYCPLKDSSVINGAAKITIPSKFYIELPKVPYIKQEYFTRIYTSGMDNAGTITNEFKVLLENSYRDYDKQYGALTKIVTLGDYIYLVFAHGVGFCHIDSPDKNNGQWISAVTMINSTYGSLWKDSVLATDRFVYGVDTVAKAIWVVSGNQLQVLSDHKVGKFLIDKINLSEFDNTPYVGHVNVKTHYNAFKHDVIFTYYKDVKTEEGWEKGTEWSLCYNEDLQVFQTFYDWIPLESANIDNIFFSFDKNYSELQMRSHTILNAIQHSEQLSVIDSTFSGGEATVQTICNLEKEETISGYDYFAFYIKVQHGTITINGQQFTDDKKWLFVVTPGPLSIKPNKSVICDIAELHSFNSDTTINDTQIYSNLNNVPPAYKNIYNKRLLWKHGQGGIYDNQGEIKPTNWYGKQHQFQFEFVVKDNQMMQKIFHNLKLVSNKTEPYKIQYEVVGEGYELQSFKPIIQWIHDKQKDNTTNWWLYVLSNPVKDIKKAYPDFPDTTYQQVPRLPYITIKDLNKQETGLYYTDNTSDTTLIYDKQLNEYRLRDEQLCNNINQYGRIKGNCQYLEDFWDIEIRPLSYQWCYLQGKQLIFKRVEAKHRDKYMKVKLIYSGEDLAVVQAIYSAVDYSFA